jgi:hypothetical protein
MMRKLNYLILAAALTGCASSSTTGSASTASTSSSAASNVRASSPDYITSIEVEGTSTTNAYDLIRRLRPRWLQSSAASSIGGGTVRGQMIVVVLDGQRIGGLETLRTIGTTGIKTLQYYDATRAATVVRDAGTDPIAGAIVITTTKIQ